MRMARPLRIEFAEACYHVMSRGNEGRPIFNDDADYLRFLEIFAETVTRFGWIVYSWVLMTNHFHLEICTPEANLSRGMHWLNGRYAQWFNRRYKRRGHLFQDRFKSVLVEGESYLLELARYIVRNPVRAGMVKRVDEYRWSSYRSAAGIGEAPPCLDGSPLVRMLGENRSTARKVYVDFVSRGDEYTDASCRTTVGQIFLGSDEWLVKIGELLIGRPVSEEHPAEQLAPLRPRFEDITEAAAKIFDRSDEEVRNDPLARKLIALIAFEDGLYRQIDVARELRLERRSRAASLVTAGRRLVREQKDVATLAAAIRRTMKRRLPDIAPPPTEFTYPFRRRRPWIPGAG